MANLFEPIYATVNVDAVDSESHWVAEDVTAAPPYFLPVFRRITDTQNAVYIRRAEV